MPKDLARLLRGVWYELSQEGRMGVSTGQGCRVWAFGWGRGPGTLPEWGGLLLFPAHRTISTPHGQSSGSQLVIKWQLLGE